MQSGRPRRDLEYDYLAVSYQLARLVEERLRQAQLIAEVRTLERHLTDFLASPVEPAERRAFLAQIEAMLREVRSLLPLDQETRSSLANCQELHARLVGLGRMLGYPESGRGVSRRGF